MLVLAFACRVQGGASLAASGDRTFGDDQIWVSAEV